LFALGEIKATVDVKDGTRDIRRVRTDKERDGRRHVFWSADTLQWDFSLALKALFHRVP
jgi:hypothetical protein